MKIYSEISNLEDWFCKAPPAGGHKQWKNGHSAKEFAKLFFNEEKIHFPSDIDRILSNNLGIFKPEIAYPEYETILFETDRGPRNHDLLVTGDIDHHSTLLCIEAKATETPDVLIKSKLQNTKSNSKLPERIKKMAETLYISEYQEIYYQYFSGLIGTIIETHNRNSEIGIFLVYQIISDKVTPALLKRNKESFLDFAKKLNIDSRPDDTIFSDSINYDTKHLNSTVKKKIHIAYLEKRIANSA